MKRLLTAIAVLACSLAVVPTATAGPTSTASPQITKCVRAKIEGQSRCIQRGQFCRRSARAMRDYRKYGLSCTKRDRNGRYHLE
jgi:hypothetical protein